MIHHLTEQTFHEFIENSTKPVLVAFKAIWCGPCKIVTPILEQIVHEKNNDIELAVVDIDESPSIAQEEGIRGVPTIICFKHGNETGRIVGAASKDRFLTLL